MKFSSFRDNLRRYSPEKDLRLDTSSLIVLNGNHSKTKISELSPLKIQSNANDESIGPINQKELIRKSHSTSIQKALFHQQKLKEIFLGKQRLNSLLIERSKKDHSIEKFLNIPITSPAILLDLPLNSKSSRYKTKIQFTDISESVQRPDTDLDELHADVCLEIPAFVSDSLVEVKRYKLPSIDEIKASRNQIRPIKGEISKKFIIL